MSLKNLLDQAQLDRAIAFQTDEVKRRPTAPDIRLVLADLLGFAGQWDRALKQLDIIDGHAAEPFLLRDISLRRGLFTASKARADFFLNGTPPRFALAPPPSVDLHFSACDRLRAGHADEARTFIERGLAEFPVLSGNRNGKPFQGVRNTDDRLGPVVEILSLAGYFWLPFEHLQYLDVQAPKSLLDLLFIPARFALHDGQMGEVFLPALGFGSHEHPDERIRLGRLTEWIDLGAGLHRLAGLSVFDVGDESPALPDLGLLELPNPQVDAEASARA